MGKMKDSSLLKWAHNNNKNNTKEKKKEEKKKNWIHPADSLVKGHIAYLVKFLGSTEVEKPKGIEVVKEGIRKLKFSQQIKKAEGTKTPKVELTVSVDGVAIQDPKTKKVQHQYALHRISYCADDKAEKRFFSFIAKEEEDEKHTCFVFVSDKLAEEITLTIGQAFDLAYKKFLSGSQDNSTTANTAEEENKILRARLMEISGLLTPSQLNTFLDKHNISGVCEMSSLNSTADCPPTTNGMTKPSLETSEASVEPLMDQLINLDAPVSKFDTMTLDDLNDDDFDPRAGGGDESSDSSDDFNPRSTSVVIDPPSAAQLTTPTHFILSPPAIPPREPPRKAVNNNSSNPFGTPFSGGGVGSPDPFGMTNFSTPNEKSLVSSSLLGSPDVFADLDPLKK